MFGGFAHKKPFLHKPSRLAWQILCVMVLTAPLNLLASNDRMDYVAERLEGAVEHEFIGAAVVGYYNAGEVHYASFGRVSQDTDAVPDETTLFEIGSITKVFTAALTQSLIDADTLSWDSTVKSSLEDWTIRNGKVRNISLRELATHSSGLPRLPPNWMPDDSLDPYRGFDTRLLKSFIGEFDPSELRKEPAYSNLGFGLLGSIAAHAAGKSYSEALKELVLDPLGMQHTTVGTANVTGRSVAQGFGQGAKIPNWNFEEAMAGAGAVVSSAEDMVQFIKRNLVEDDSAVHQSLKQLRQVQVQPSQAYAWSMVQSETGKPVFWHAGLTGGYASFIAISPEESKGWVLLATSYHGGLVNEIGSSFFAPVSRSEPVDLSAYLGVYRLAGEMFMTFTERENQLIGQATGQTEIQLTFIKDREFQFKPAEMVLEFEKPRAGESLAVYVNQRGRHLKARRVDDRLGIPQRVEIKIEEDTLNDYLGFYRLDLRTIMTVVQRDGQLFAMITGQPIFPVFPMASDRFFYKQTDAEVLFERDKEGNVSGLTLFQSGKHKASKTESGNPRSAPNPANQPSRPGPPN